MVDRGSGYLISPDISRVDTLRLNFRWAPNPQTALDEALATLGRRASIAVLRQAGDLLPILPAGRVQDNQTSEVSKTSEVSYRAYGGL